MAMVGRQMDTQAGRNRQGEGQPGLPSFCNNASLFCGTCGTTSTPYNLPTGGRKTSARAISIRLEERRRRQQAGRTVHTRGAFLRNSTPPGCAVQPQFFSTPRLGDCIYRRALDVRCRGRAASGGAATLARGHLRQAFYSFWRSFRYGETLFATARGNKGVCHSYTCAHCPAAYPLCVAGCRSSLPTIACRCATGATTRALYGRTPLQAMPKTTRNVCSAAASIPFSSRRSHTAVSTCVT